MGEVVESITTFRFGVSARCELLRKDLRVHQGQLPLLGLADLGGGAGSQEVIREKVVEFTG